MWYSIADTMALYPVGNITYDNLALYTRVCSHLTTHDITWNGKSGGPLIDQDKIHGRIVEKYHRGICIGTCKNFNDFKKSNINKCNTAIKEWTKRLEDEKEGCLNRGKINRYFLEAFTILPFLHEYLDEKKYERIEFSKYFREATKPIYDETFIRGKLIYYNDISNYRELYAVLTGKDDETRAASMRDKRDDILQQRRYAFEKNNPGVMEYVYSVVRDKMGSGFHPFKILIDEDVKKEEVDELVWLYNRINEVKSAGYFRPTYYEITKVKKENKKYVLQFEFTE